MEKYKGWRTTKSRKLSKYGGHGRRRHRWEGKWRGDTQNGVRTKASGWFDVSHVFDQPHFSTIYQVSKEMIAFPMFVQVGVTSDYDLTFQCLDTKNVFMTKVLSCSIVTSSTSRAGDAANTWCRSSSYFRLKYHFDYHQYWCLHPHGSSILSFLILH